MQRQRFAHQMVVWREIEREIIRQMTTMQIKHMKPSHTKAGRHVSPRQLIDPDPCERPKCDFERARPIDPAMERIFVHPTRELRTGFIQISGIPGQQVGLRQNHQVLMPVQLPNDFVIAGMRGIEEPNMAKIGQTSLDALQIIPAPMNLGAGIDGTAKDRKPVRPDVFRKTDHFLSARRSAGQSNSGSEIAADPGRGR